MFRTWSFVAIATLVFATTTATHNNLPVIKDGVPQDTPEVEAAKAEHFRAYAHAKALATQKRIIVNAKKVKHSTRNHLYKFEEQVRKPISHNHEPPLQFYINPGVPAAVPSTYLNGGNNYVENNGIPQYFYDYDYRTKRNPSPLINNYYRDYHLPRITKDGVPEDTAEVQEARRRHFVAVQLAHSGHYNQQDFQGHYSLFVPVIGPHGVPYDTPEVQHAKYQHFLEFNKISH